MLKKGPPSYGSCKGGGWWHVEREEGPFCLAFRARKGYGDMLRRNEEGVWHHVTSLSFRIGGSSVGTMEVDKIRMCRLVHPPSCCHVHLTLVVKISCDGEGVHHLDILWLVGRMNINEKCERTLYAHFHCRFIVLGTTRGMCTLLIAVVDLLNQLGQ